MPTYLMEGGANHNVYPTIKFITNKMLILEFSYLTEADGCSKILINDHQENAFDWATHKKKMKEFP